MATQQDEMTRNLIENAILGCSPMVALDPKISFDDVRHIIRVFMRKHPEIFWFSHQYRYDEKTGILRFKYNFSIEKADFFKGEIEKVVKDDFQIDYVKNLSEIERLVYVYKWIANRTTYNEYSSFNQTIYSVLVNRNSVCTGYAKTAQYLLNLLGIESELVFGKFHSDRSEYGRHGWNIVKINGKWYHIDFCLADRSLSYLLTKDESPKENNSILWNYFGVPTGKILSNRSIEFVETLPECNNVITRYPDVELLKPIKQLICCKSDSGTSSRIYLNSFNKNRVIKVSRNDQTELLNNEAVILSKLSDCSHIIKSYGLNDYGLGLEQLTPWSELLNSHYYNPTESDLRNILRQLIEGLIECREIGISYSDIHYNNVFVSKHGTYKWGDFGIAYRNQSDGKLPNELIGKDGKAKGSYWFMAPETYHQNVFKEYSANYSLAMMAYFVMNDMHPPFWTDEEHKQEALTQRLKGKVIPAPICADRFDELWSTIQGVLSNSIESRPCSFEDFINQLDSNVIIPDENLTVETECSFPELEDSDNPILIDNDDGCFDDSFVKTLTTRIDDTKDPDSFATTMGGRWGDGGIHDSDSFACTAAFPGNSLRQHSDSNVSYHPKKKSPRAIKMESKSGICNFWENSDSNDSYQPQKKSLWTIKIKSKRGFWKFWKNSDERTYTDIKENCGKDINACVYAPAQIQPMKTFIVRVYLYKPEESEAVDAKVKDIDPKAQKKEYKYLEIPVREGDKLTVQLKMSRGITLDCDAKNVVWRNHFTDCSFMAKLTSSFNEDVFGTAYVSVNGIPAGELLFTIDVVDSQTKNLYAKVESRRYSRIFISYSHADEMQVRGFAECCRALGTDYFFDRHTLRAGDIFKDKILDYINHADLFVLCWSKNAAESEWVQIERKHAMSLIKEGKAKLSIYPLSLKPEAPLPLDMSDKYNFGNL